MANEIVRRFRGMWDAFRDKVEPMYIPNIGPSTGHSHISSGRYRRHGVSKDSVIIPIYNRIGIDVSSVDIRHVRVDDEERFRYEMDSMLNECFALSSNIDQTAEAFFRDAAMTLCGVGAIAIVPVETRGNPINGEAWDVSSIRIGEIVDWFPRHIRVNVYNDETGFHEELVLPKSVAAIVENPLYAVMNEPNSTLQRLLEKLRLLDVVDEQSSSGKLDLLIQLPYVLRGDARKEQAEQRRKDIEEQLTGSKYGIAYTDGTERVTQLNRAAENNLLAQVEYLTNMLYGQLGLTREIIDGTADEAAMINYFSRTVEPFLKAITMSMTRTFLSKTARTQGQRITYHRDPFKLVPVSQIAEISDKFTRNEIATSNEIRSAIGWKPSDDPKADELRNSNLSAPKGEVPGETASTEEYIEGEVVDEEVALTTSSEMDSEVDSILASFDEIIETLDEALMELGES